MWQWEKLSWTPITPEDVLQCYRRLGSTWTSALYITRPALMQLTAVCHVSSPWHKSSNSSGRRDVSSLMNYSDVSVLAHKHLAVWGRFSLGHMLVWATGHFTGVRLSWWRWDNSLVAALIVLDSRVVIVVSSNLNLLTVALSLRHQRSLTHILTQLPAGVIIVSFKESGHALMAPPWLMSVIVAGGRSLIRINWLSLSKSQVGHIRWSRRFIQDDRRETFFCYYYHIKCYI